jgi:sporulation protein YlmC with PRC-barrel domain
LKPHVIQIVPKRKDIGRVKWGPLAHFSDLEHDYMIADPVPDFRDWNVTLPDGEPVGKVDDLVIDTSTMTAKYVELKVYHDVLSNDEDRWMLVPVESIDVDEDDAIVIVESREALIAPRTTST